MTSTAPEPEVTPAPDGADDAALLAEIDAELAAERVSRRRAPRRLTGGVLLGGAIIAWIAALVLLVDKLYLLANPGAQLSCDVNPFISCGNVMMTWQAEAFGIPNMALGLGGYAVMGVLGAQWLSGQELPRWLRLSQLGGIAIAFAFIHFLAASAIFVIRALCPWCMVAWVATAPMFFVSVAHAVEIGDLPVRGVVGAVLRRWVLLSIAWYALLALVIVVAFRTQWMVMLGLI